MPTGVQNNRSRLYSMRLPLELADRVNSYAQTYALGRTQAFVELLTRGLDSDAPRDTPENTPQMVAELETRLMARIEALEAMLRATAPRAAKRTERTAG